MAPCLCCVSDRDSARYYGDVTQETRIVSRFANSSASPIIVTVTVHQFARWFPLARAAPGSRHGCPFALNRLGRPGLGHLPVTRSPGPPRAAAARTLRGSVCQAEATGSGATVARHSGCVSGMGGESLGRVRFASRDPVTGPGRARPGSAVRPSPLGGRAAPDSAIISPSGILTGCTRTVFFV